MNCNHEPTPMAGRRVGMDQHLVQAILIRVLVAPAGGLVELAGLPRLGQLGRWLPFQGYGRAVH
ncbi:MAG: hypothetical protein KatS3mg112_0046 [Thermogutta sp.]|nr:MAG: hypothetical protein KatS3mg112_0046 [Thermogutta sp.]